MEQLPQSAIIAAIIAGVISLFSLIISKENKISEFRQEWVNSLRNELATLIACVDAVNFHLSLEKSTQEDLSSAKKTLREMHEAKAKILLRINPKENLSIDTIAAIDNLLANIHKTKQSELPQLKSDTDALIAASQKLLKFEWDRVKRGERIFFVITCASIIFVAVTTVMFIASFSIN